MTSIELGAPWLLIGPGGGGREGAAGKPQPQARRWATLLIRYLRSTATAIGQRRGVGLLLLAPDGVERLDGDRTQVFPRAWPVGHVGRRPELILEVQRVSTARRF